MQFLDNMKNILTCAKVFDHIYVISFRNLLNLEIAEDLYAFSFLLGASLNILPHHVRTANVFYFVPWRTLLCREGRSRSFGDIASSSQFAIILYSR